MPCPAGIAEPGSLQLISEVSVRLIHGERVICVTELRPSANLKRAQRPARRMFGRTFAVALQLHPVGRDASGFA